MQSGPPETERPHATQSQPPSIVFLHNNEEKGYRQSMDNR